jgi:hypothetical protein
VPQNVSYGSINLNISASAFLVMESSCVSNAGQHQAVPDSRNRVLIEGQPRDRANRPWNKQEPV